MGNIIGNRILITGGAGFIGSHLSGQLAGDNELFIIDNLKTGRLENLENIPHNFIHADIAEADFSSLLIDNKIDMVFHLATCSLADSIQNPDEDFRTNLLGGFNLVHACKNMPSIKKIVYTSTGSVYGEPESEMIDESTPIHPVSPYGVSKASIDHYLRVYYNIYKLPSVTLRYYNIYGPGKDAGVVPTFIRKALLGENIYIDGGDQVRTPTYVKDAVKATILAAASDKTTGEAFNISGRQALTVLEMAKVITSLVDNWKGDFIIQEYRPAEIMKLLPDVRKAKNVFGWQAEADFKKSVISLVQHIKERL